MKQTKNTWSRKLLGVAGAFGLTFAMACATAETDEAVVVSESDRVAVGEATDPLGPPQHIASRPITDQHPSSNTGFGNHDSSGANTNLNRPAPAAVVVESDAVVTQTPIIEEERIVVAPEPEPIVIETPVVEEPVRTAQVTKPVVVVDEVEEDEEEVEIRRVTRKE